MGVQVPAGSWRGEVYLPSERGSSRHFTDQLLEQLAQQGWAPAEVFAIHLAAEEAIVNAIIHGNRLDPAKSVHVVVALTADRVTITITDQGDGFDPNQVPDCTLDERIDLPSGRGVMLMRSFMTRIEYNAKGNSVVMEKVRS